MQGKLVPALHQVSPQHTPGQRETYFADTTQTAKTRFFTKYTNVAQERGANLGHSPFIFVGIYSSL